MTFHDTKLLIKPFVIVLANQKRHSAKQNKNSTTAIYQLKQPRGMLYAKPTIFFGTNHSSVKNIKI